MLTLSQNTIFWVSWKISQNSLKWLVTWTDLKPSELTVHLLQGIPFCFFFACLKTWISPPPNFQQLQLLTKYHSKQLKGCHLMLTELASAKAGKSIGVDYSRWLPVTPWLAHDCAISPPSGANTKWQQTMSTQSFPLTSTWTWRDISTH